MSKKVYKKLENITPLGLKRFLLTKPQLDENAFYCIFCQPDEHIVSSFQQLLDYGVPLPSDIWVFIADSEKSVDLANLLTNYRETFPLEGAAYNAASTLNIPLMEWVTEKIGWKPEYLRHALEYVMPTEKRRRFIRWASEESDIGAVDFYVWLRVKMTTEEMIEFIYDDEASKTL